MERPRILTLREAASRLGISVRTLQRMHQAGKLYCVLTPLGRRRRVPEYEVARLEREMGIVQNNNCSAQDNSSGIRRDVLEEIPKI